MCGIVGIWDFENPIEPSLLEAMRNTLEHRGPDDRGLYIDEEMNLGLGHQRLSAAGEVGYVDEDGAPFAGDRQAAAERCLKAAQ